MKRSSVILIGAFALSAALISCKKEGCTDPAAVNYSSETDTDDESCFYATKDLTLDITGLPDLGPNYKYETWLAYNNMAISLGTFDVDASGNMSTTSFTGNTMDIESAQIVVISIEPFPDADPTPSDVKILGGGFSGNTVNLTIAYNAAVGSDLSLAEGEYVIDAPTTNSITDNLSGIWFFNPGATAPQLELPALTTGWRYEGWAVIGGVPMSTGKFTNAEIPDNSSMYSATEAAAPSFPGEDFVQNAPAGFTFPTDLSGQDVFISVEPVTDNSPYPFVLRALVGTVPTTATSMTPYTLTNAALATCPVGTGTR
ncbi:MAG: anti-sigma factor [Crocinitomicaceae bacterium]|nr:anti-sigma factor [Crocinitomicaceae bacterium]